MRSLLLLLLTSLLLTSEDFPTPRPRDPAPNLIFLLADDLRHDALGYAGNPTVRTPHLDGLAARSTVFENAYVTTSICAVSRASILSGQYARRHGIVDFSATFSDSSWRTTYPALLRQAGYHTGFVGKWGVGERDTMGPYRFDHWAGFGGQGRYEGRDSAGRYRHLTRRMGEEATTFIEQAPTDRPFLLNVSFKAPHVQDGDARQFVYDTTFAGLYADADIPRPPTAAAEYFERLPAHLQTSEGRRRWRLRFATDEQYEESVRGYYRLITGLDAAVGSILLALHDSGRADNTLIVFMGDNGFYLGEHGLAGKWFGHRESIRVPLLIYLPGGEGRRVEEMALNIDIGPTLLSAAGLERPPAMQGDDLLPFARGTVPRAWREDFFYEHLFSVQTLYDLGVSRDDLWPIPQTEGVVSRRWKYLYYPNQKEDREALYDLAADPHETVNLVHQPRSREDLDRLRARLQRLRKVVE